VPKARGVSGWVRENRHEGGGSASKAAAWFVTESALEALGFVKVNQPPTVGCADC
jgi:hypothetical protein